jgi:hypothetical protein
MNTNVQGADPRSVHLQWFAEEGNPPEGSGKVAEAAGSFAARLIDKPGSAEGKEGTPPAQDAAPKGAGEESHKQTPSELPGYVAGFSKGLKADQKAMDYASKFKTLDDAIRAGMEAESKIGGMVGIPGKDATPEEKAAYLKKIGYDVPDKPEDYELTLDKRLEQDPAEIAEFKATAKALGLTKDQAKSLYLMTQEAALKDVIAYREAQAAAVRDVEASLHKQWGEEYPVQVENAQRALRAYGSKDLAQDIEEVGIGNKASFIQFLARIGKITREDSAAAKAGGQGGGEKSAAELLYPNQK